MAGAQPPPVTVRRIQWAIAAVFFILGGWALVAPRSVIDLTLLPEYRIGTPILPFAIACFGAQAMIAGLLAAVGNVIMPALCVIGWRRTEA